MHIHGIQCGPLDVNSYILWKEENNDCVVIDPAETDPILAFMKAKNLKCTDILLTHGHFDHIAGVAGLKEIFDACIHIHKNDAHMLYNSNANLSFLLGLQVRPVQADVLLEDGDEVNAGLTFKIIYTPGHTPGSICYLLDNEKAIFTGDTLFRLGVGRADFPNSNADDLYASIKVILFGLPGDYTLYPGHMRTTTLDFERSHNPFVRSYRGK